MIVQNLPDIPNLFLLGQILAYLLAQIAPDYRSNFSYVKNYFYRYVKICGTDKLKGAKKLYFIIRVWSLFCSVWVYMSLHFLPIYLVKLSFRLYFSFSCFSMFRF